MVAEAHKLLTNSLSANTKRSYSTGQKSYLQFCSDHKIRAIPARPIDAVMWLTYLNTKPGPRGGPLSTSTIENYRFAVHSLHTTWGLDSPFAAHPLVRATLKAIRRARGPDAAPVVKLPITRAILCRLMPLLNLSNADDCALAAAMWVATTGLFRPGEVAPENLTDTSRLLTVGSIRTTGDVVSVHLAESKTDSWRTGVDVQLRDSVALNLLRRHLSTRPTPATPDAPLFALANGHPLTHKQLVSRTEALLARAGVPMVTPDGTNCRGVSFRKGGATDLAATGVSDKIIQTVGRWRSYCSLRYIHPAASAIDAAFRAAAIAYTPDPT